MRPDVTNSFLNQKLIHAKVTLINQEPRSVMYDWCPGMVDKANRKSASCGQADLGIASLSPVQASKKKRFGFAWSDGQWVAFNKYMSSLKPTIISSNYISMISSSPLCERIARTNASNWL